VDVTSSELRLTLDISFFRGDAVTVFWTTREPAQAGFGMLLFENTSTRYFSFAIVLVFLVRVSFYFRACFCFLFPTL